MYIRLVLMELVGKHSALALRDEFCFVTSKHQALVTL